MLADDHFRRPSVPAGLKIPVTLTPAQYKSLHRTLGTRARSRRSGPRARPACRWLSTRPTGPTAQYVAALGLSVILFIKLGGDSGLTFILPFLMFIFLLALGRGRPCSLEPLMSLRSRRISVTGDPPPPHPS